MHRRAWFRPPRHPVNLFLLIAIVPFLLVLVLGGRSFQQERARQLQDSREQAADLAVSSLQQSLSAMERQLAELSIEPGEDAVVVRFEPGSVQGRPLFYPFTKAGREAPAGVFAKGDD